jgi:hypothetical protein
MLYCETCGQCCYIDNSNFIAYTNVSGVEKQYIDPENGDVVDGDGMEDTDYGDSAYQCPHCNNQSVDFDWDGTEEEAFDQRAVYERRRVQRVEEAKKRDLVESIKNSNWDYDTNELHS